MGVTPSLLAERVASLLPKTTASACIPHSFCWTSTNSSICGSTHKIALWCCSGCESRPNCHVVHCYA